MVLCVGGGIAAYKVASLLRLLTEGGARVRVVPTAAALRFVGEPTWAALSGQSVAADLWEDVHEVPHVAHRAPRRPRRRRAGHRRPAARAAAGMADDLLTNGAADRALPGADRPGDAHRDVGAPGHPGQRGDPARGGAT